MVEEIVSYSGLLTLVAAPLLLYLSWRGNDYSIYTHAFSHGVQGKRPKVFSFSLIFILSLEILFIWSIVDHLSLTRSIFALLLIIVIVCVLLVALVSMNVNRKLHIFIANVMYSVLVLIFVGISIELITESSIVGWISLSIVAILTPIVLLVLKKYGHAAVTQIALISSIGIWNLYFSYVILV